MGHSKPFYRNVRGVRPGKNSGYSGRAFIEDPEYARNPGHFTRALLLIIGDLRSIFEFVEPSAEGASAYSYRIHALLMRTCIEIEANFKAILEANSFTPPRGQLNIRDFRRIDATHHLSSYEAVLPIWSGGSPIFRPFEAWRDLRGKPSAEGIPLAWYQAYNATKHDRQQAFHQANLGTLVEAVSALLILITSQFRDITFEGGPDLMRLESGPWEPSAGGLFQVKYPEDWEPHEQYDFDWSQLKNEPHRFDKIDYDLIPI